MSTKIKIDHVTGGKNKDDLKNCYFELSPEIPGTYDFCDRHGNRLAAGLNIGEPFEFDLDGLTWVIFDWATDSLRASGNWRNDGPALEQSGTFTAQAGGGVDDQTDKPRRILPLEQISIFKVTEDGVKEPVPDSPLLGCFFSPQSADEYMFFGPGGEKHHSNIVDGEEIDVEIGGQRWTLTTHFHPHHEMAHGRWKLKKSGSGEEDQGGTFTAQAGGGLSAASAYA